MARPAFYRIGYSAGTGELWIAYDLGLAPEKPEAHLRFCRFDFASAGVCEPRLRPITGSSPRRSRPDKDRASGCRLPGSARSRTGKTSAFRFKEGNDETAWDDAHGILTFRYTEPMTWWMPMPKAMPRTIEAAIAEARRLADQGNARGQGPLHQRLPRRRRHVRGPASATSPGATAPSGA